jgi:hypothetical protein
MRHSTLELTGRYTRPRAVDIDAAVSMLLRLKPTEHETGILAATKTDPRPVSVLAATENAPLAILDDSESVRKSNTSVVTGEGLEPSTNGLTYLIGFHRPSRTRRHERQGPPSEVAR